MTWVDPLEQILEELERAGIPHMLAGSFASTYHGDPRTTHDIDLARIIPEARSEKFESADSSRTSDRRPPETYFQYVEEAEGRRP
jgi:predicted nucleotidyltransferase